MISSLSKNVAVQWDLVMLKQCSSISLGDLMLKYWKRRDASGIYIYEEKSYPLYNLLFEAFH